MVSSFITTRRISGLLWIASLALICLPAWAGQPQITGGGAKISIDFTNSQSSNFLFVGMLPAMPGFNVNGATVSLNLGGIQRTYTLSPDGEGVATPDLFQLRDTGAGYQFICTTFDNTLATAYASVGLTNATVTNAQVGVNASITVNSMTFTSLLTGVYDGILSTQGKAFVGVIQPPSGDPFAVLKHVSTLAAHPNPSTANQLVTFKGAVSLKNFNGAVGADMHFGDMSMPIHADGASFQSMLKSGITHTYTADGVYVARVTLIGGTEVSDTRLFVIVGSGWVVNSKTGAVGRLVKNGGGTVTLQIGLGNVPGSMNAQTQFVDMAGNMAGMPPNGTPTAGQMGFAPVNTFSQTGIFRAQAMALDGSGNSLGLLEKTIAIGTSDLGSSSAIEPSAASRGVKALDATTDADITLTAMSGKFNFYSSSKVDTVVFTGTFGLPAGYTPKNSDGNDFSIGMGNVIDTVHLTSKGKLVLPTSTGTISKFKLTPPHLPTGVAVGGETAKVSITMTGANLDLQGYDAEGITVDVRADEAGQTSVARFVQVDMVVSGTTYSVLAQVSYETSSSSNSDFGTISARN